jgi:hypothetical protein
MLIKLELFALPGNVAWFISSMNFVNLVQNCMGTFKDLRIILDTKL